VRRASTWETSFVRADDRRAGVVHRGYRRQSVVPLAGDVVVVAVEVVGIVERVDREGRGEGGVEPRCRPRGGSDALVAQPVERDPHAPRGHDHLEVAVDGRAVDAEFTRELGLESVVDSPGSQDPLGNIDTSFCRPNLTRLVVPTTPTRAAMHLVGGTMGGP